MESTEEHRTANSLLIQKDELPILKQEVIKCAILDKAQITNAADQVKPEVQKVLTEMIGRFDDLQRITIGGHPPVYEDTDVVLIIPGPGSVIHGLGEVTDRYSSLAYTRKMNRARVRVAIEIMLDVTKRRLAKKGIEKTTAQITREDILNHGPYLHYADPPERMVNFTEALRQYYPQIPQEKVFMYDKIIDLTGEERDIVNTADQMHGLVLPDMPIRRIVAVADPAHLLRAMYQLGRTPERIPDNTVVQAWPIHITLGASFDQTKRQLVGTLTSIYKLGTAAKEPYPYIL